MQGTMVRCALKWKTGHSRAAWKTANEGCGRAGGFCGSLLADWPFHIKTVVVLHLLRVLGGHNLMDPLGIGLIGCGNVGSGVAKLLLEHPERMAARAGRPLELRHIVVRDLNKLRPMPLPA